MPSYEFEIIQLKNEPLPHRERNYRWKCRRGHGDADHDGLEGMLNDLGRQGWSVVAFDTDARWGSNLILQRAKGEPAAVSVKTKITRSEAPPTPDPGIAALTQEITALRSVLSQANLRAPIVNVAPATVQMEGIAETLAPLIREIQFLRQQPALPSQAVLSAASAEQLALTLERAVRRTIEAVVAPQPIAIQEVPARPTRARWFSWAWGLGRA